MTGNSGGRMEGMAHFKKQLAGGKMSTCLGEFLNQW